MKLSVLDQSPVPAGFTPADALQNTIELARFTEDLGYSRYWIAEHHATGGLASPAPEIMITRVAAETSRIRVGSGAVLLSHYSALKVVETFRVLHALYPDRIDLGVGRAPGSGPLEAYALQAEEGSDPFPQQLAELLAFVRGGFPAAHPFSRILVSPDMPGFAEVWLLGSSGWSADAAAHLSLPYAAAHFINPETTRRSLEHYRSNFAASEYMEEPRAIVAVGVICAETEAEALRLSASQRLRRILMRQGDRGPIPTPEDAIRRLSEIGGLAGDVPSEWPRIIVGAIDQVREKLTNMADELAIDEVMAVTVVHDHAARMLSYELLANAFGLDR